MKNFDELMAMADRLGMPKFDRETAETAEKVLPEVKIDEKILQDKFSAIAKGYLGDIKLDEKGHVDDAGLKRYSALLFATQKLFIRAIVVASQGNEGRLSVLASALATTLPGLCVNAFEKANAKVAAEAKPEAKTDG